MKTTFNSLLTIGLAFVLASCGSETPNETNADTTNEIIETTKPDADNIPELNVKLNNGERWEVNTETSQVISEMQSVIGDFSQQGTSREVMYKELSEKLMYYLEKAHSTNTTKGEAHDQLEKYLQPMKRYFEDLNSGDASRANNSIEKLKYHLKAYNNYFE